MNKKNRRNSLVHRFLRGGGGAQNHPKKPPKSRTETNEKEQGKNKEKNSRTKSENA
jgi:hypothetical protein